ncbi:hypothetical protein BDZ45DRAFT_749792 [Acephala macrosclerotiorum]|nr:hypothetical protein BDZ45DRAFT_749792 [Acephala macrosclerotiorum]
MAVLDFLIIAVTGTIFAMIFVVRTQELCTGPVSPKTATDQDFEQPRHLLPIPEFDVKRTLKQYYYFPVAYALAVTRVDVELRADHRVAEAETSEYLNLARSGPESGMLEETVSWLQELTTFERNIFKLCFHIGVEVVKFAPAKECLRRLREHTLN